MAEYSKQRKNSALQELKRLQEEDRAAGIHYEEPELRHFDAQSVFEANKKQEPQRKSALHIPKVPLTIFTLMKTDKLTHLRKKLKDIASSIFPIKVRSVQIVNIIYTELQMQKN